MKMNKTDMLGALKATTIDNGLVNKSIYNKNDLLKKLGNFMPKADGKGKLMDDIRKNLNTDLSKSDKKVTTESIWKPIPTDIKSISKRFIIHNTMLENSNPNAFRLDVHSLVLDKTHAKFSLTRAGETAIIDLLYPNANGNITVKISVDDVEDNIYELTLEDEEYVGDFGASILAKIDEMISEKEDMGLGDYDSEYYISNKSGGMSDMSPNWVSGGDSGSVSNLAESDRSKMKDLMALVEADDDLELDDDKDDKDDVDALKNEIDDEMDGDLSGDASSVNADGEFSADDFSIDGGDNSLSGLGGDLGGDNEGVNSDENGDIGLEDDVVYMQFNDKTDWLNSSLDTMQKLVASNVADQMQKGDGVILTQDEILNGSVGIKNDTNAEIIDKFLKVYPSLNDIEFKEDDLNRIEEKLSLDDGQFDSWLQSELPGMRGDKDVSDVLDNDMFDTFEPMGGEEPDEGNVPTDFDDFMDATDEFANPDENISEDNEGNEIESTSAIEDEEAKKDKDANKREAELEVNEKKLNEFPNV